jgi:hypothetical protein
MSPEAQRIAIAEACGWNGIKHADYTNCALSKFFGISPKYGTYQPVPDYLNDLNAMHEAEKVLPDMASDDDGRDQLGYMETLADTLVATWSSNNSADTWLITHATAAQRAEAFLRNIGKWEGQP